MGAGEARSQRAGRPKFVPRSRHVEELQRRESELVPLASCVVAAGPARGRFGAVVLMSRARRSSAARGEASGGELAVRH